MQVSSSFSWCHLTATRCACHWTCTSTSRTPRMFFTALTASRESISASSVKRRAWRQHIKLILRIGFLQSVWLSGARPQTIDMPLYVSSNARHVSWRIGLHGCMQHAFICFPACLFACRRQYLHDSIYLSLHNAGCPWHGSGLAVHVSSGSVLTCQILQLAQDLSFHCWRTKKH